MSDCLRPQGVYSPWNSPGQNTAVGESEVSQSCPTLEPQGVYSPWNSPGQNTAGGESESEVTQLCLTLCDPHGL